MYRDAGPARPKVLVTIRPLWRPRFIRRVLYAAIAALSVALLWKQPMMTLHLERVGKGMAEGTLCERHGWLECEAVGNSDARVYPRPDVILWLAGSSRTFDFSDGGIPLLPSLVGIFGVTGAVLAALRRRAVRVVRSGAEIRIEDGARVSSILLGEVRRIEIDSVSVDHHGLVFVLADDRRVPIGAPSFRMSDAVVVRGRLRAGLDLAVHSRALGG